jgi:antitoxin ChpS
MYTTNLRKVGGSVMLAVPPAILDLLHLEVGEEVGLEVENGHLLVAPRRKPHYTLEELLEQCDPSAPLSEAEQEWLNVKPVGLEI